jgi:single-strand DNA-binding protein
MSVNKVILVGRLGQDPEHRFTPSGQAVCKFSMATNRSFRDRNGQMQKYTEWHKIVTWAKLAEICQKYLKKGSQVYIEGRIQSRQWEDKQGQKRAAFEIIASEMKMLDSRGEASMPAHLGDESEAPAAPAPEESGPEVSDEDIPF